MKFFSRRNLPLILYSLAILLIPLWHRLLAPLLRAPAIAPLPVEKTEETPPASGFSMNTLTFVQFNEGRKELMLSAQHAISENTDNQILLSDIDAELYDRREKAIRLQSGQALYDVPKDEVTLRQSVKIRTDEFTGATEELHYFPEIKVAETNKKVEIDRAGLHITGTGLNFDIGAGELEIGGHGRVHCLID